MKDHLLNWHERFQPLGPALKTPRIEVDEKSAIAEFERRSFDHPSCTGGNAPSLSPLVTTPAARVFKVGDRVRHDLRGATGVVTSIGAGYLVVNNDNGIQGVYWSLECVELLPSQPSDTQQWVEWDFTKGKPNLPLKTVIEVKTCDGELLGPRSLLTQRVGPDSRCVAYRVVQ